MSLSNIKLPLWALDRANACHLDHRIAVFEQHHGHPPDDDSTLAEWWAVTPDPEERIWAVCEALPLAYPGQWLALRRVAVEVAYLAACRAQARATGAFAAAGAAALALVRRWLDGEHGVLFDDLRRNAWAARSVACAATRAGVLNHAIHVVEAAARSAADAAAAYGDRPWLAAASATDRAATFACTGISADDAHAAFIAELVLQHIDLDRLLLELNLEGPCPKP